MYHRASELKHIFNENMKGGTGTVEIIRSVNPIDYESPAKMIAKLILRPGCSLGISFSLLSLTILPNYRQNRHQSHWRFPVQSESDKSPLPYWNLRWDLSYIPSLQLLPVRYSS